MCALRNTKHIDGTNHVGLDSFNWIVLVMHRGGWACQVVQLITLDQNRLGYIVTHKFEICVISQVRHITLSAGK